MPAVPKPVMILLLQCSTVTSRFENVLYYEPPTGISTVAQMNAVANGAFATFAPLYSAVMNQGCFFSQARATYNDGTNEYIGYSSTTQLVGSLSGTPLGDQNSVVLRKMTNLTGRQNRGRIFVGGLDSTCVNEADPNEIDPSFVSHYEALAAALATDQTWDTLLFHARHWDRKNNALQVIAAAAVSTKFATSRRRRRGAPNFAV